VKVSEYQQRGLVHLHLTIRLDKRMPKYRDGEICPPDQRFTSELIDQAFRATVEAVSVKIPNELGAGTISWGASSTSNRSPPRTRSAGAGRAIGRSTRPRALNRPVAFCTAWT